MKHIFNIFFFCGLINFCNAQTDKLEFYLVDSVAWKYLKIKAVDLAIRDKKTRMTRAELSSLFLWDTIANCEYCFKLRKTNLRKTPFLTLNEIQCYNWKNHNIELNKNGSDSIRKLDGVLKLGIPGTETCGGFIHGIPFVVVANDKLIYEGWIFSKVTSQGCDRVRTSIMTEKNALTTNLKLEFSQKWSYGEDPRSNELIKEILLRTNKYIEK
jgi:hypothetical protein